jgi:hypothetical protein
LKVRLALWPFSKTSVLSGCPATVTWCGERSVLVQVIVLPGSMVTPAGPKVNAPMLIGMLPGGAATGVITSMRPAMAG